MTDLPIFTIGYGNRPVAELIALLQTHAIAYLIDVRAQPYARFQPDYQQPALRAHLRQAGITYVFMGGALGGRADNPAQERHGRPDDDDAAAQPAYQKGIERLVDAHSQQLRIALLCAEARPEQCHRSRLIGRTLTARGLPVAHIDESGTVRSQEAILARDDRTDQQGPLRGIGGSEAAAAELPTIAEAQTTLKRVFGFDEFRPLQRDIISNLLQGRDTLAIMPTGSGKSLCYQLPGLLFNGVTVVVSPLISLMQDQVDQLTQYGVAAVTLNSSLAYPEYLATVAALRRGEVDLLYVAPETLLKADLLALLREMPVACLAIDEAHCISQWGHDFRPEYRQLVDVRRQLPHAVCLAVTATATDRVRRDIVHSLDIPAADTFIASFDRPNLFLKVEPRIDGWRQLLAFLEPRRAQSGIIYCATRAQVDDVTAKLQRRGWSVRPYHAGLDDDTRRQNQRDFVRDDVAIIVATVAFGMGIDKADVRFVAHYALPKNIEHYYQEIGRAGRDGQPATCLLLFSAADIHTIRHFIRQQAPGERAGAEARLQALLAFAECAGCRREPLLDYFGEAYAGPCDRCDNCAAAEQDQVDISEPARMFLTCVLRTSESFGAGHIVDVLRGSRSKKIRQRGHDRLEVYGAGIRYKKSQWQLLTHQLLQQGLIWRDSEHGGLRLTPAGRAVLNGQPVFGVLAEPAALTTPSTAPAADPGLLIDLRALRKRLADELGVPPYVIFHDRSLEEMAGRRPATRSAFSSIYGVGEAKLEKYADLFLESIATYCRTHDLTLDSPGEAAAPAPRPAADSLGRRTRDVVAAYLDNRPVAQIAESLGVQAKTVVEHLWKYVRSGAALPTTALHAASSLPEAERRPVLDAFAELGVDFLRPVFDRFDGQIPYEELHLLRLIAAAEKHSVPTEIPERG